MNLRRRKWKLWTRALLVVCGISVVGLYHIRTVCSQGCTIEASVPAAAQGLPPIPPCHADMPAPKSQKLPGQHEGFCCQIGEMMASEEQILFEAPPEVVLPPFLLPTFLLAGSRLSLVWETRLAQIASLPALQFSHIPTTVLRI